MATVSKITIDGHETAGFNVGDTVGNGCSNGTDNGDVLVVQIMLYMIAHGRYSFPLSFELGLTSWDEVPEPTGKWDAKTGRAILKFQQLRRGFLPAVDGIIHPASYSLPGGRQRNIRWT